MRQQIKCISIIGILTNNLIQLATLPIIILVSCLQKFIRKPIYCICLDKLEVFLNYHGVGNKNEKRTNENKRLK